MEDSFRVRVDKTFGTLSSSETANLSSLWSLTDDEIERNEWNRDKDEPEPEDGPDRFFSNAGGKESNGFRAELEKDILDLDDGRDGDDDLNDNEEEKQVRDARDSSCKSVKDDDYNDEEWEIKSNIGMDCTLDYEQEEDAYDKVAIGKEKPGDRLYMKDVNDYGIETDSHNELPDSFEDVTRDPRANHIAAKIRLKEDEEAAKIRLKEDAEAAKKMDSLHVSEQYTVSGTISEINPDSSLKSILKRSDTESGSRRLKRVRFDSECKENDGKTEEDEEGEEEATNSIDSFRLPPDYPSGIPDYMRNPSKYTRYTFDPEDMDDKSNKQAYMDFLKMIRKRNDSESADGPFDLPKSVPFVPKRKTGDATMAENDDTVSKQNQADSKKEPSTLRNMPIGIAARVVEDDETSAMEEDQPETVADLKPGSQKSGRKYRTKANSE